MAVLNPQRLTATWRAHRPLTVRLGHDVTRLDLRELPLRYCVGCWGCWVQDPWRMQQPGRLAGDRPGGDQLRFHPVGCPAQDGLSRLRCSRWHWISTSRLIHPYIVVDQGEIAPPAALPALPAPGSAGGKGARYRASRPADRQRHLLPHGAQFQDAPGVLR